MQKLLLPIITLTAVTTVNAAVYEYTAYLDGPTEPSASLGVGSASAFYDDSAHTLRLEVVFSGLTGTVTAAHIHAPTSAPFSGTAGVVVVPPSLPGFPLGGMAGTYSHSFDLTLNTSYNASYITANGGTAAGAEAAIISMMNQSRAYLNIHSSTNPGGEIRGFWVPVPEPSSMAIVGVAGLLAAAAFRKRA